MTRTKALLGATLLAVTCGCSAVTPRSKPATDCTQGNAYEFLNIVDFSGGGQAGWYWYGDNTPGSFPAPGTTSNLNTTNVPPPGRCGDTSMLEIRAFGHDFYGTGFGDYNNMSSSSRADGTGYVGISFWARSDDSNGGSDKTFGFFVDDGRTLNNPPAAPDGGVAPYGPGDIVPGTECKLPPPPTLATPACYNITTIAPLSNHVPEAPSPEAPGGECGNQFHTYVTTTTDWQLFLIPFSELQQWPCPNRLSGGVQVSDIAQIQVKFLQGTSYDLWLDNFAFYRPRTDGGP